VSFDIVLSNVSSFELTALVVLHPIERLSINRKNKKDFISIYLTKAIRYAAIGEVGTNDAGFCSKIF